MPIKSIIIPEYALLITRVTGYIDDYIAIEHEKNIAALGGFNASMSQLADARGVTQNHITQDGLIKITHVTPFISTAKRAYLVSDKTAGIFSTIFATMSSEDAHFLVTYEFNKACKWLDVDAQAISGCEVYTTEK